MSNKITIEKSVTNCIEKKLNKLKECLKKGYNSIKREDLCQLCIYEEGSVNEFLAWDDENDTTPLNGTKSDLVNYVIKMMNKNGVNANHYIVDDAIVEWLSEQLTWIWNTSYGIFHINGFTYCIISGRLYQSKKYY